MSLPVCAECSTAYAVGLEACPQCGSTAVRQAAGASMLPQMQVACQTQGCRAEGRVATVRLPTAGVNLVVVPAIACTSCGCLAATVTPFTGEESPMPKITRHGGATNELPPEPGTAPADGTPEPESQTEGGEQPSPGSSSETSSTSSSKSTETSKPAPQKRARTTASRSSKARTAASSAPGTGGGQTGPTSETE